MEENKIILSTDVSYDTSQKITKEQLNSLQSSFSSLALAMSNMYNPQVLRNYIGEFVSEFTTKIKEIYGDGINGYEQWGLCGWTFSPSLKYDFFKNMPISIEEANSIMEKYLNDDEINTIKNALQIAGVDTYELEEAFNCYNQGMYKSCSLILFGIIDNKIYTYGLLNARDRVELGSSFAKDYVKIKKYDEFTIQGIFINILKAIETIFCDGNNFTDPMMIINRNYLTHGMSKRNISKLECFQIWCLAYSTWVMLDVIEESTANDGNIYK